MSALTIIQKASHSHTHGSHSHIHLPADRATLAKRRWRGVAEDGREFGFDLHETLAHGNHFHHEGDKCYTIQQTPETVLEIPVTTLEQAARVAWSLGNLHFGVQVLTASVRVTEDPAVLQLLTREGIAFQRVTCVFQPLSAAAHHHAHNHDHGHHHG